MGKIEVYVWAVKQHLHDVSQVLLNDQLSLNGSNGISHDAHQNVPKDVVRGDRYNQRHQPHHGITLYCLGGMVAVNPSGKEIISRHWGDERSVLIHHKHIIVELVSAKIRSDVVSRMKLLSVLFPELWNEKVSEKKLAKLDRILTVRLTQLKKAFRPYEIFEKKNDGYKLHPSVNVSLFETKKT